jgi:hypothetical protein
VTVRVSRRPNLLILDQLLSPPYNSFIFNTRLAAWAKIIAEKSSARKQA